MIKKLIVSQLLTAFLSIILVNVCKADDLYLVNGRQQATIVLDAHASFIEQYAAQELQRAVQIMSGATLSIITTGKTVSGPTIIIGTPVTTTKVLNRAKLLKLNGVDDEQIAVLREGNTLYLAGKSPRAALYATYTFLQDVLGVRWFWPGKSGEFIPERKIIRIARVDISESPTLKIRTLSVTGGSPDEETDTWMARNKMNVIASKVGSDIKEVNKRKQKGFLIRVAGHNVVLPVEMLKEHPEYLPEIAGKRQFHPSGHSQLCWSNPEVQNEVAKIIAGWWDQSPFPDVVHFFPADNTQYCECAQCKAMGDISSRWQKFSGIVIAKVNQTHPGKKYWTYAYLDYKKVPHTSPAPFEFIGYTLYDASYRDLLSSGSNFNKLSISEIDGWLEKGVNLGIRGYEYIIFRTPMYVPMVSWVTDQISWMNKKHLTGYLSELPAYGTPKKAPEEKTYWTCNRMALYAAAKSMWKSDITADSIVNDWCSNIYGPAAGDMSSYYWDIEKAWRANPKKVSVFNNYPVNQIDGFLSTATFQKLYSHFSDALTKIALIRDTVIRNRMESEIALEGKMLANWQSIYNMKYGRVNRYKSNAVRLLESNDSWKGITKLPQFEDKEGSFAKERTDVSIGWTNTDLLLHVVCHDKNAGNSKVKNLLRDETMQNEDCIEILIQPDPYRAPFMRFTVNSNSNAKRYDAKSYGGINFDETWNPKWTATGSLEKESRVLTIRIPFTSLGISPRDQTQIKLAIRRRLAAGLPTSGWPDASPVNTMNFGLVTFFDKEPQEKSKKIILYDSDLDSSPLSVELQQRGWTVNRESSDEGTLKQLLTEDPNVLLVRYLNSDNKRFGLSVPFLSNEVKKYVQRGGILIVAANEEIPIHTWFSELPSVKWDGSKNAPVRKSSYVLKGDWLTYPNNITSLLNTGATPVSGYTPLSTGWEILAKMKMLNGEDIPFLLRKQIGKGMVVLTSAPMGYNAGFDMFRNSLNVAKLIENLQWRNVAEK